MTRIFAYLNEAVVSLWRNKVRSVLTMLGMIIGTSSIITVFGLSKAATSGIEGTLNSFGTFPITVNVDFSQNYPDRAQLRPSDAQRVADDLGDEVHEVQPSWTRTWRVAYGTKADYYSVSTAGKFQDDSLAMDAGRKIAPEDVDTAARVVDLSESVAAKFFPNGDAVGKDLTMNGARYTVIGVYAPIKSPLLSSLGGNDFIAVPYSTFARADNGPPDNLLIYPVKGADIPTIQKQTVATLQHIHGPQAQYQVVDAAGILKGFDQTLNIVGTGLAAIGTVALFVAGIGIMNIMLVTVTERTREIGLRKSIGASRGDIMLQFLMESVVLAVVGGGTGMAFGLLVTIGGANLLSKQLGDLIIPYVFVISIALGFSIAVGMFFGLYPAYRAATKDPIEALRT